MASIWSLLCAVLLVCGAHAMDFHCDSLVPLRGDAFQHDRHTYPVGIRVKSTYVPNERIPGTLGKKGKGVGGGDGGREEWGGGEVGLLFSGSMSCEIYMYFRTIKALTVKFFFFFNFLLSRLLHDQ